MAKDKVHTNPGMMYVWLGRGRGRKRLFLYHMLHTIFYLNRRKFLKRHNKLTIITTLIGPKPSKMMRLFERKSYKNTSYIILKNITNQQTMLS